jgi:hypothetical protein
VFPLAVAFVFSVQAFPCREAIDGGDAWSSAVPVVHPNRIPIIVVGHYSRHTSSLSEELGERAEVIGVFAGHLGQTRPQLPWIILVSDQGATKDCHMPQSTVTCFQQ